jgi:mannosyltransferase
MEREPDERSLLPALACMIVAALLRWPSLNAQSLWIDEIYSVEVTRWPLDVVLRVQDGHPPLYALLQILVGSFVPEELSGRVISAVAGVIGVGLLVHLGTTLWGRRVGLVAGLLLACSPLHVWYSQEGRMYALVVMLAISSSIFLVRAMRHGGAAWLAFAIASLCGIFTHYLYAGLVLAQGVFLLVEARMAARLLAGLAAAVAVAIAVVPVLGPEATTFVGDQRGFEWMALPYVGFTFVGGFGLGPSIEELHRERDLSVILPYWPAILVVAIVGITIAVVGRRAALASGVWGRYLLLWATAPILFVFAGSWLRNGAFNVRYVLIALPAVLLLAALGLAAGGTRRLVAGTAALLALSLVSIARDRTDVRYGREDFRSAARYLQQHAGATDRIVVSGGSVELGLSYYAEAFTYEQLPARQTRTPADAAENLRELTAPTRPTWLVLSRDWENDPAGLFAASLADAAPVEPQARFAGVRIYYFAPATAAGPRS